MRLFPILLFTLHVTSGRCSPLVEAPDGIAVFSVTARQSLSSANSTLPVTSNTRLVKGLTTSIASVVALWTAATFFLVIKYGPSLSQGLVLPLSSLERNLSSLLSDFWIANLLSASQPNEKAKFKVLRFAGDVLAPRVEKQTWSFGVGYQELGLGSLPSVQQQFYQNCERDGKVWFNPASPVMKHIIQMAIWEFWSFWMVVAMVALTVMYNGFIYQQPGPDGVLRLVLISAYAAANIVHILWSWRCVLQILSAVGNQACWVLISNMCLFFSIDNHRDWLQKVEHRVLLSDIRRAITPRVEQEGSLQIRRFHCDLLGQTKLSKTYVSRGGTGKLRKQGNFPEGPVNLEAANHLFEPTPKVFKSTAEDDMKPMLDSEVKVFEKAGESGLDRVLANVIVILGVCLSTGLAPWTTIQSQDSTATQIGSYAIILAVSTGMTALIGSITHLSNAVESAKALQRFQSHMLSLSEKQLESRLSARAARYGSPIPSTQSAGWAITWLDLCRSTSPWLVPFLPLWGPALGLLSGSPKGAKREKEETPQGARGDGVQAEPLTGEQGSEGGATDGDDNDDDHTGVVRFKIADTVFQFDAATATLYNIGRDEAKNHDARRRAKNKSRVNNTEPEQGPAGNEGGNV